MTPSVADARSGRGAGHIVLIVFGALLLLLSLTPLARGAALVAVHTTQRDTGGFYASGTKTLATPTRPLVSNRLDVGTDGPDWRFREGRLGTIGVTAADSGGAAILRRHRPPLAGRRIPRRRRP